MEPPYFVHARRAGRVVVEGWFETSGSWCIPAHLVPKNPQNLTSTIISPNIKVGSAPLLSALIPAGLTYVAGRTRFDRLLLIGTSSSYFYLEALKAAIAEAKQGSDVGRYEYAVSCLREIAPNDPDASPDVAWIESTKAQVKRNTDTLELELKTYKNNLIKESIRVCGPLAPSRIYWLTFHKRWATTI